MRANSATTTATTSRGPTRPLIVFPADYEPCEKGALSAGAHHSALVDGAGALWTWGWTEHGRLGRDSVEEDEDDGRVAGTPGMASLPGGGECVDVSCGAAHTIVVDNNGFVSGCGWNEWGQATGRMNASSVAFNTSSVQGPVLCH